MLIVGKEQYAQIAGGFAMKRFVLCGFFFPLLFAVGPTASPAPPEAKKDEAPIPPSARKALEARVDLVFHGVGLQKVLDELSAKHQVVIVVGSRVRQQCNGKINDLLVDVALRNVKLGAGLGVILDQHGLSAFIVDNLVYVSDVFYPNFPTSNDIDLDYEKAPVEKVLADLVHRHKVNVVIDPKIRGSELMKTPITLTLKSVSAWTAVEIICDLAGLENSLLSHDVFYLAAKRKHNERTRFLADSLHNPIREIDRGDVPLPLLLDTISAFVSPPEAARNPNKQVTIVVNVEAFKQATDGMFDIQKQQIRFESKLTGVPLSGLLEIICEQFNAGYMVRNSFIEILPLQAIRKELNCPHASDSSLRRLVSCFYDRTTIRNALDDLGSTYNRNIVISSRADKHIDTIVDSQLVNVPFETAVETLANLADLRVVRQANVLFVTGKDQAVILNAELAKQLEADRQAAEKKKQPKKNQQP
jgi:hypothetical protein